MSPEHQEQVCVVVFCWVFVVVFVGVFFVCLLCCVFYYCVNCLFVIILIVLYIGILFDIYNARGSLSRLNVLLKVLSLDLNFLACDPNASRFRISIVNRLCSVAITVYICNKQQKCQSTKYTVTSFNTSQHFSLMRAI